VLADTPPAPAVDAVLPSRARISESPPAGNYVVVDVAHFSTTVAELFANDAAYVHVTEERGNEPAFRAETPDAVIGGASTESYEPEPGYDLFNSPSYVQDVDVADRPVAMTSTNGGAAVTTLRRRGGDDVTVYVGGLSNAPAVADHLAADDDGRATYLVAAGSRGKPSPEDTVGAIVIGRHLAGEPPDEREMGVYRQVAYLAKAPKYAEKHPIRTTDLVEYDLRHGVRDVVPRLRGQKLYDVSG
jgi:2-phosphosulfolactate phosphatase